MKINKLCFWLLSLFCLATIQNHSQNLTKLNTVKNSEFVITAKENETLTLTANEIEFGQHLQWQESNNNTNWVNINGATTNNYIITLNDLPKYYRAFITESSCDTHFKSDVISVFTQEPSNKMYWSDPNSWETLQKPKQGERVVIPKDKHIYLDENTPELDELIILGTLEFEREDLSLTAKNILVNGGQLIIGEERRPFTHKAIITLNDTNLDHNVMMQMGTRGIIVVNGGRLDLHGKSPETAWTKIDTHAEDGATKLNLAMQTTWKPDDEIVLGPSDFYEAANGESISQRIKIAAVNGKEIELSEEIKAFHWGALQYVTTNGISLTAENIVPTPTGDFLYDIVPNNPKILDERAPVGNLTRNIVIQAPNDDAWQNEGFGIHIMMMPTTVAHINGVEIKRGGQRGRVRRYPFHWHMLSYKGSTNLGDATGQYFKNSTINESKNRGIVVHGTNGTVVQNNIVFDVKGHGIFTENGAERRTLFDHNLVLKVRNPEEQFAIKKHELEQFRRGSSGFWISNPDNTTTNNHVGDCEGNGYWLAFPMRPFGESSGALYDDGEIMDPRKMPFGVFENNTAHSCNKNGFHNDDPELDEEGNTGGARSNPTRNYKNYTSDTTGRPSANMGFARDTWRRFDIKRFSAWKCTATMWDRANFVNTLETVTADNHGTFFAGSGTRGLIIGSLAVGRSLNYNYNNSKYNDIPVSNAFASYHHTFDIQANIAINFPGTKGVASGVFGITDYYLRPVEKGHWLSKGNILINSHPGVRITASEAWRPERVDPDKPHFNLSGAIWDPNGIWGPSGNYLVPDDPFYTYNSTKSPIGPNPEVSGGVSVTGPYYGFDDTDIYYTGGSTKNRTSMKYTRYDDNLNKIGGFTLYGNDSNLLQVMKDVATQKGGIFEVSYPDLDDIYDIHINKAANFLSEADELVIAYEFPGTRDAKVSAYNHPYNLLNNISPQIYTQVSSFEAVKNATSVSYWQDKANDKVWMKIKGGIANKPVNNDKWEDHIYQFIQIRIWEGD
ncbi:G8 domain-containing protein [Tenacibaculum agarivorans]|uniref:G8 domain-containing protein n=1 Tax=Tenacibaculum agarivorans TaxID=1908389 RepID=UPI00094B99DC|nr:G8 domain-containing protein [Tenacibaculum agarivorans]